MEKEIAFIGRITAGVTHEVNNVLASIREISGLLSDILSIPSSESFSHKEKFETSIQKIEKQEKRGVELINQLNKFAHLPDVSSTEVDLDELIEHLIFLTERFGRIKNIQLQAQSSDRSIKVISNPFYLQMALFYCIEYFLRNLKSGGKVSFNAEDNKTECSVKISAEGEMTGNENLFDQGSSQEIGHIDDIVRTLGGVTEYDNLKLCIRIKIPVNN